MTPRTVARRLSVIRHSSGSARRAPARGRPGEHALFARLGRSLPKSCYARSRPADRRRAAKAADGGRMETLLEILYATGLRVSELVTLPLAAAERDPTGVRWSAAGDKERLVALPTRRGRGSSWLHVRAALLPRRALALPVSLARPHRPSDPPALRPAPERGGAGRRHRSGAGLAARVAPCLRQPSAGGRRRPAQRAIDAGPCRYRHDPDLHPRLDEKLDRWCRTSIRWRAAGAGRPAEVC